MRGSFDEQRGIIDELDHEIHKLRKLLRSTVDLFDDLESTASIQWHEITDLKAKIEEEL